MRIETYWEDAYIYLAGFYVRKNNNQLLMLHRVLIFKQEIDKEEVEQVICLKFANVCNVVYINLWDEFGLLLK